MTSTVLTERRHSGGFIVSEASGQRSRDQVTILQQSSDFQSSSSPILPAGLVLGVLNPTAGTYAADAANTGNFTCGAVTVAAGTVTGVYRIEFTAATAFNVYRPDGSFLSAGATGSAFSHEGLGFTLTAGGTAAVAGDNATITLADSSGGYAPLALAASDGSEIAAAILFNEIDASGGNTKVTVISRAAEVNGSELVYPAAASAAEKAAANGQLAALGIIVR